jgi:phthiocerol/phenolphthiocerol synthesis type-I polyketide synthase E
MIEEEEVSGIAIVGMSGRFPGAETVEELWRNLRAGTCSITFWSEAELLAAGVAPEDLADPRYVRAAGVLAGADLFDAPLFGLSPREAEVMDPQQRVFLECAWAALEDAGYDPARYPGWIGVYAGAALGTYLWLQVGRSPEALAAVGAFQAMITNDKDYLATQASYRLNLKGPSLSVQTACSTSLVAVHLACQGLVSGECDLALAGGVSVSLPERRGYLHREGGIASPDGYCRPFDAAAAGTVRGGGVGIVVLKRLADALADGDRVLAVIRGSAINNDGMRKVGYTAPSVAGQAEVIAAAQAVAGVAPETIGYVEAHGTATSLGDPIEVAALTQAFGPTGGRRGFCALGSVKGNLGHLDAAAGVAGLIKTTLALAHAELPASLHYERPNPRIDFAASPFYVNACRQPWPAGETPRRAGVSSFGIGGTNAHVVLEEAPPAEIVGVPPSESSRPWHLLPLSARTGSALGTLAVRLAGHLRAHGEPNLADVSYTLQVGRRELGVRRALLARDGEEAAARLAALAGEGVLSPEPPVERPAVAFVFSGQGAQYPGMGAGLYRGEPVFREVVSECCALLGSPLGEEVRRYLTESGEMADPHATWRAQPALFVCEYALARLFTSWGVVPSAVLGHSVGEYGAACFAGVLPLAAALSLVALRGRLMQALPPGAMLAVGLPETEILPRLGADLALAAVNGPEQCVVSGPEPALAALAEQLAGEGRPVRRLRTSHAFHSATIDPMLDDFRRAVERVPLAPPEIPYASSLLGGWAKGEPATADYWVRQARETVRFGAALASLQESPERVLLEIGPRQGLSRLAARAQPARVVEGLRAPAPESSQAEDAGETEQVLGALGELWTHGVAVDWERFHAGERRRRVSLPAYPFERKRYWIEPTEEAEPTPSARERRPLAEWFYLPSWRRTLPPVRPAIEAGTTVTRSCLILHDAGGLGEALGAALAGEGWDVTSATTGESWEKLGPGRYRMRPGEAADHARLWEEMAAGPGLPSRVLHLWNVARQGEPEPESELARRLDRGFYSLFHLAQALARHAPSLPEGVDLVVFADRLHAVESADRPDPVQATLLGICRVLPQEQDRVRCRTVDVGSGQMEVERCLAEIEAPPVDGRAATSPIAATVAWRGSYRYVPSWDGIVLHAPHALQYPLPGLRHRGVYLITGGLGGLGLEIARFLAETVQARLVLVGRSAFPDGEIHRLRALEALGSELQVLAADVADPVAMAKVRERVRERFGAVHGVFHAAGVAGGGLLATRTAAAAAAVLAPKVQGTLVLSRLFADAELLVLCSSLAALVGGIGQADYAAANAFLDSFAAGEAATTDVAGAGPGGGRRTIAIDWDAWRQVGMAAETEIPEEMRDWRERQLTIAIAPAEGREALGRVLGAGVAQIAISPHPLAPRLAAAARLRLSAVLSASAEEAPGGTGGTGGTGGNRRARRPRPAAAPPYAPPSTALEARLAEVWADLLGVEPVGRDDDFFALGGHSLLALQLAHRVRETLGAEVPLEALVAGTTLGRLAQSLGGGGAAGPAGDLAAETPVRPDVGRLVTLQPEGSLPPFFCIHPAGGGTWSYADLVRSLGPEQPFHAFQSDGLDTPLLPGLTLERMAASYAAAIRQARPTGPYHLGGWSMGGLVAYEVAQQLRVAGRELGLLVLFDTRADTRPESVSELPEDEAELLYILYRDELDLPPESYAHMRSLPEGGPLAYIVEAARRSGLLAADFGLAESRRLMDVYMRNRRLMWNYTPRPFPGSVVLFQARDRRPGEELPLGLRWDGLVQGGLRTIVTPGDHNRLLEPPYVGPVAEALQRIFAAFASQPPP